MKCLLLLFCMSAFCLANAQKKLAYTGSVEGGLLLGNKPVSSFVLTTQGVAYKQFTFGVGSGFDFYRLPSVPLFVDAKKIFSHKQMQPYVEAAAGVNFTNRHSSAAKNITYYSSTGKFDNGSFIKGGGGLLFRAQKKIKVLLSAGYTYKTATFSYTPVTGQPWAWQIQPVKDVYQFHRWYTGVGISW